MSKVTLVEQASAPSTPSSGQASVYIDQSTKKLATKDDTGAVTNYGAGGGGGYDTVQHDGSGVTQRSTVNFTGPGITAADNAGQSRTDVTVGTAAPSTGIGASNSEGSADTLARSDHNHTLRESGGQNLTLGAIADGQTLQRSGTAIVGVASGGGGFDPRDLVLFDHFMSSNNDTDEHGLMGWREFGSGTGSAISYTPVVAGRPGVVRVDGGTGSAARRGIACGDSSGTGGRLVVGGTNLIELEALVRFPTTADFQSANLLQAMFGFGLDWQGDTELANGVYWRFQPGVDTNWTLVTANGGSRSLRASSNPPVGGTWIRLGFTATATSIQGKVNGVNAGSPITTNIPTMGVGIGLKVRSAGGAGCPLECDYYLVKQVTDKEGS